MKKNLLRSASIVALTAGALAAHAANIPSGLELKEGDPNAEIKKMSELMTKQTALLEDIQKKNTELSGEIDTLKKAKEDGDTAAATKSSEEIDTLKEQIAALETKANRPGGGENEGEGTDDQIVIDHKKAFNAFMKKGNDDGLESLETKALNIGTDAEGGYAVPDETDRNILNLLKDESPFRGLADVQSVGSENYSKIVNIGGTTSGWVGESDARAGTDTPSLVKVTPPMGEIYANPSVTQRGLDDIPNAASWLEGEVTEEFSDQEGASFVSGNGTNKPKGILVYTQSTSGDATRTFGEIQKIKTGIAADFPATDAGVEDMLIDLVHSMKAKYRKGAVFLMNTNTVARLRKLRDGDGRKLWRESMQEGQPSTLLGYPVYEDENMPDIGAGNSPVAFGNFKRGYKILDRMGTRIMRDPFSNKPYVSFYATKRVGGGVIDSLAIKVITCEV